MSRANQAWSADITYIGIDGTNVYLTAFIDWYSKANLAYSISNTIDTSFVTFVLNEAIRKCGNQKIFNTDQGSQHTSNAHTE
ncbi:MAG: DDE-type integrase/transposase/recombinase [Fusobacteria bacterium]|nr:DDE-type integrase/transposase/recombinase [Fusobacteriota bacterium]